MAYAEKGEPSLENEDIRPYFEEFRLQYQELIIIENDSLQTNNLEANRIKDTQQAENDIAELQNQLTSAKEDQLRKDGETPALKAPFPLIRLYLAWSAVSLLSLFEGLINRPSFSAWGYAVLEAVVMSIAFAGLLAVFAHSFERIVKKGKTVRQQLVIAIALIVFLIIIFWSLADVRAKYLATVVAENTGDNTTTFSPVPFALLSVFLFIASVLICHFFLPNREHRAAMRDYKQHLKERLNRMDKIARLEAAIAAKESANDEMNRLHNSLQEYGAMLEQRIINQAKHGLELWKKHNFLHRSDGRPKSFDNTQYQLEFKTFFHHVNIM